MKNRNEFYYYIQHALCAVLLLAVNGAILQTFMQESGISSEFISRYTSFSQVLQVSVMLLASAKTERAKNVPFVTALSFSLQLPFCICLLIFCFLGGSNRFIYYIIPGILASIGLGIYNIVAYKLPYHILDMKRYGFVTGVSGVISGIAGIIFSALMSGAAARTSYFRAMSPFTLFFVISAAVCALINFTYKTHPIKAENKFPAKAPDERISLFKDRSFRILFIPNFLRGFNMGLIGLAVTAGYHIGTVNSTVSGYLIVLTSAASLLSSFLYSFLAKKNIDKWIILVSSVLCTLAMTLCFASKMSIAFLGFYAAGYLALNLINIAIPVSITKIVDYGIIGRFTAWRMALNTLGVAIAGILCIPLIDIFGAPVTFLISGIMQIISGSVYFALLKQKENEL